VGPAAGKGAPGAGGRLDALARAEPAMRDAAAALRAVLAAMRAMDSGDPGAIPAAELVRVRLAAGLPALGDAVADGSGAGPALLGAGAFRANTRQLARHLAAEPAAGAPAAAAAAVADALERGPLAGDAAALAVAALTGDWSTLHAAARRAAVDEAALATVADYVVRPALRRAAASLEGEVQGSGWAGGECPVCGAPPLLAELRGGEGERTLRCGRCAAGWSFPRVGCPGCGSRDHRVLGYLHGEGEDAYRRADWCRACGRYVKAIAALDRLAPDALLEEDLASAGLDMVAVERGFHR
jgi:FdhE protein